MDLLAFDFGASGGKAIAGTFDSDKLHIQEIHRFPNEPVMLRDGFYWDVLRLFHELKTGIRKYKLIHKSKPAGIGIDTWGVDYALIDKNGFLIGNPFHYRDSRTLNMLTKVAKNLEASLIYRETGIQIQKFNTLFQLYALKLQAPCSFEIIDKLLFLPDYFNYLLSGEKSCELTIASTSQLFNSMKNEWSGLLLGKLAIPKKIFCDVTASCRIIGDTSAWLNDELTMEKTPVISVAGHDTASAVVAVPLSGRNHAYLNSGTWSLLGIELEKPIINELSFRLNYTNEGGIKNTFRFLKNIMGLWILQECKREWENQGDVTSYTLLMELAEQSASFGAFINPDHEPFYTPGNMCQKIIEYCRQTGQKVPADKGAMVRCILESLSLKYKIVLDELEMITGQRIDVLNMVGGGCNNRLLCQLTANATSRTVVSGPAEATVIGNLLCQLMGLGEISSLPEARMIVRNSFVTEEYFPENINQWLDASHRFEIILKQYEIRGKRTAN